MKQTYYANFLKNSKYISAVYTTSASFGSLENVLSDQDATADLKNGWQSLYEYKNGFEDRS